MGLIRPEPLPSHFVGLFVQLSTWRQQPIPYLHAKCKILSLEQRRRKQLLRLMFNLSKDKEFLKVPNRVTRGAGRVTFKVPAKIFPSYERSPFYVGTKLWDELTTSVQESVDIFAFKKEIDKLYRVYVKL